jgi:succinate dehydrogenase/fumarate reductase flavoprotein subunit
MHKDLEKAVEFSIKWPRGELGSLPADSEQFLLIEDSIKDIEKIQEQMESMMHNKVNIERLQKDVEKIMDDLEKLKDKVRENGSHG